MTTHLFLWFVDGDFVDPFSDGVPSNFLSPKHPPKLVETLEWPFPNICSLGPHCSVKFEGVTKKSYKQFSHHKVNQTSEELMHNYMVVHCDAIPQESSQSVNPSRWCGCFCWWLMQMAAASLASLTVFLRCFLCDIGPEDTMTYIQTQTWICQPLFWLRSSVKDLFHPRLPKHDHNLAVCFFFISGSTDWSVERWQR